MGTFRVKWSRQPSAAPLDGMATFWSLVQVFPSDSLLLCAAVMPTIKNTNMNNDSKTRIMYFPPVKIKHSNGFPF